MHSSMQPRQRGGRAHLTAVHVYSTPVPWGASAGAPAVAPILPAVQPQEVIAEVRRFSAGVLADDSLEVVVSEGNPSKEIVRLADERQADLLVMGTHGRGGFERLFLGSVTEKVIRTARCPVLTVPPPIQTPTATALIYKTILCPLDFSDASQRALEYALSLAKKTAASVLPLHVVEGFIDPPDLDFNAHYNVPEYRRYMEEDALTRLNAVIDDVRDVCNSEPRVVRGKAAQEILRVAEEVEADLIVMGVHGTGAADRFGSTTHRIVREAPCPVLTLRAARPVRELP